MYYFANDKAYFVGEDGKAHQMGVTVTEKKVVETQIESITPKVSKSAVKLPADAVPASLENIVARFGITEDNPLTMGKKG